ncbi:nicastrin isoform X1 [Ricinus communis]|uniref:nicastrin isoform X1 n=1 Tax=Ricinus communis TaxID=3988 RepID=UPI00077282CA|nr:nicastrin isoform X1 [Ricinus communis]|eukprot:XP_015582559.1 nicastrin isoform X1 [Ricinus communis]
MAASLLSLLILLPIFRFPFSLSAETNSMQSVPDLQKSMYMVIDGYPCVRLLNLSGEIGCANPGRDKVVAPVIKFKNVSELAHLSAVLVSLDDIQQLFDRISNDPTFAKNVGGILVQSGTKIQNKLIGFSPAPKFPEVEFAPYHSINYEWNPIGSGIMKKAYNFPVFLLSEDSSQIMQEVAVKNENKKNTYTADVAEFDLVMQTTKSGTHDSESCLREETCLPLGGYSVWSSLPPINISSTQSKPIILTVASMDSASFFRDKSLGAESPISGLISLLAAVDSLSRVDGLEDLSKQLVFSVFTGEAWGYLGSRRFLLELDLQTDSVNGINDTLIEMVMEIGSVGKGFSGGNKTFFAHTAGVSPGTNKMLNAFKGAEDSLESKNVTILSASTSNPGIPPSSLMAFLRKNSSITGIVLEDFDSAFSNKFYQSHLDDISNIHSSAIVAAASLIARTLYILASGSTNFSNSALSAINVNASLVEELMGCLLDCDLGLSCELVKNYISPTSTCPSHYVGVIIGEPSSNPYIGYVDDISRFIWNFLADRTSVLKENSSSDCSKDCSNKGEVCIKAEMNGKGVCVTSTTRYVPAYSTRLKYESGIWSVLPSNYSDSMGMVDPVWTESNWDAIGLRVYTVQNATFDNLVLVGGIAVTVLAYVVIVITRAFITKASKRD